MPSDRVSRTPKMLLNDPAKNPLTANTLYSTELAMFDVTMSCVPPAPRLVIALYIPTEQKQTNPTRATCVHGELSAVSELWWSYIERRQF